MKKFLIFLFMCLPMMAAAQTTLTPEQKLEQAQRQLEEAKAALEQAKANAAKAKAEAEARAKKEAEDKAKAKDIEKKIADMKAEAERLSREAEALSEAANKAQTTTTAPMTKAAPITTKAVSNASSDAWVVPTTPTTAAARANKNVSADSKANKELYLQKGIIPEVNGQVVWTETFNVPGATADELYDKAFAYRYDVQGNVSDLSAEQWITDKYALNKKQTRLLPVSGKFRRATVDRKNSIFEGFAQALK